MLSHFSHSLPFSSILFHSLPFSSILFHSLPSSSILFLSISFSSILFHTLPYSSILFHSLRYSYITQRVGRFLPHFKVVPRSTFFGGEIITNICSLKKCFYEPLWMVIKLTRACADGGQIWQLSTPNRHALARFMGGWFGGWFTQIAHVVRTQWCDFYSTSKWFVEALFLGRNNNEHMFVKKSASANHFEWS